MEKSRSILWASILIAGLFLLPVVLSVLPGTGVEAAVQTIHVDKDNTDSPWDGSEANPYQEISDAITAALDGDGDIIIVHESTIDYNSISIDNNDDGLTIQAATGESPVIDGGNSGDVVYITGDDITIDGLTIEGSGGTDDADAGIEINNADNCEISNCVVSVDGKGIWLRSSTKCLIGNNTCNGNGEDNIALWSSGSSSSNENTISDNEASNSLGGRGIYIYNSAYTNILRNVASTNKLHGIALVLGTHAVISHNVANGNTGSLGSQGKGVLLNYYSTGSDNNVITHNHLEDNTAYGILMQSNCDNNDAYRNAIIDCNNQADDSGSGNDWFDSTEKGNYWSDYTGVDADPNGIGDSDYVISGTIVDQKPLFHHIENTDTVTMYQTIDDSSVSTTPALDEVNSGDTIYLGPGKDESPTGVDGRYREAITIDDALDYLVFKGAGMGETTICGGITVEAGADYVEITGLKVTTVSRIGIEVGDGIETTTGIYIHENDCSGNGLNTGNDYGIKLTKVSQSNIEDNICSDTEFHGIYIYNSCDNNEIERNTCEDNGYDGIRMETNCDGNSIIDNDCDSNGDKGINLRVTCGTSTEPNTIQDNTCDGNTNYGIVLNSCDDNLIANNWIKNNGDYGIKLTNGAENNDIHHNDLENNNDPENNDEPSQGYDSDSGHTNTWDDGSDTGNYWDNYGGSGDYSLDGGESNVDDEPQTSSVRGW